MKKGFTVLEILLTVVIFAVLLGLTVPKFISLIDKSKEGSTKHQLTRLRSAIAAYYGENQGEYPTDDLTSLVPRYIEAIPQVKVPGLASTSHVSTGTYRQAFTNKGGWAYVNDPDDPYFGEVFVNTDRPDSFGTPWYNY